MVGEWASTRLGGIKGDLQCLRRRLLALNALIVISGMQAVGRPPVL